MDKPSQISELLHRANFVAEGVLQRGQYLHQLNRLLAKLLGAEPRLHCRVSNVRDGILILYTDSTAWATRLRYQTQALLKRLQPRNGLETLNRLEFRVQPMQKKQFFTRKLSSVKRHHHVFLHALNRLKMRD